MKWIDMSKRKPETNELVLLFTECGEIIVGGMAIGGTMYSGNPFVAWDWIENHDIKSISHWMPLPEPPQCEQ